MARTSFVRRITTGVFGTALVIGCTTAAAAPGSAESTAGTHGRADTRPTDRGTRSATPAEADQCSDWSYGTILGGPNGAQYPYPIDALGIRAQLLSGHTNACTFGFAERMQPGDTITLDVAKFRVNAKDLVNRGPQHGPCLDDAEDCHFWMPHEEVVARGGYNTYRDNIDMGVPGQKRTRYIDGSRRPVRICLVRGPEIPCGPWYVDGDRPGVCGVGTSNADKASREPRERSRRTS